MSTHNPLQKYYRQPKIFIQLPSKGLYYRPGTLLGDYNNVPIFAMSGMDEILLKTPDALFNGESTIKVIESCCPFIKDASVIPGLDIDALLIAIRIATYGNTLSVSHRCPKCDAYNDYDIELGGLLDYFSTLTFKNTIEVTDEITVHVRPLTYSEISQFSIEHFKLQKTLFQLQNIPEEEQKAAVDRIYQTLADLQFELMLTSIESVKLPGDVVTDKEFILDWLKNTDRDHYNTIKLSLEKTKNEWSIPEQPVECSECQEKDTIAVSLDSSNFFG